MRIGNRTPQSAIFRPPCTKVFAKNTRPPCTGGVFLRIMCFRHRNQRDASGARLFFRASPDNSSEWRASVPVRFFWMRRPFGWSIIFNAIFQYDGPAPTSSTSDTFTGQPFCDVFHVNFYFRASFPRRLLMTDLDRFPDWPTQWPPAAAKRCYFARLHPCPRPAGSEMARPRRQLGTDFLSAKMQTSPCWARLSRARALRGHHLAGRFARRPRRRP